MAGSVAVSVVQPVAADLQRDRIDSFYSMPSPHDPRGFSSADTLLTIENDPGSGTNYYWSMNPVFNGTSGSTFDGAYMGLQTGAARSDGTIGKVAIFSVWGADPGEAASGPTPNSYCSSFGGEGTGAHCLIAFDWVAGRMYDLNMHLIAGSRWGAWVIDTTTGTSTEIGSMVAPATEQWIKSISVFSEQYAVPSDCPQQTVSARFEKTNADDGAIVPTDVANQLTGDCHRARVSATTLGIRHQMDLPAVVDPGPGDIAFGRTGLPVGLPDGTPGATPGGTPATPSAPGGSPSPSGVGSGSASSPSGHPIGPAIAVFAVLIVGGITRFLVLPRRRR